MVESSNSSWTSPKTVLKSVGPKLVPFFKTAAMYFVLAIHRENPSWFVCVLKCLPVIWLCIFVLLHGISLGEKHTYSRRILCGLAFSCLGDAFLVWPRCFTWGMISFAVAHVFYISAFGTHPVNFPAGVVLCAVAAACYRTVYPGLHGLYGITVPIYILLLMLMVWRAIARVQFFEDLWTWTRLSSCVGGILFALSDTLLGLRKFSNYLTPPYIQTLIMVTYYGAQLGIVLSVVDSKTIAAISAIQPSTFENYSTNDYKLSIKNQLKKIVSQAAISVSSLRRNLI